MNHDELKPCPFCGGTDLYVDVVENLAWVGCCNTDCDVEGPSASSREEAVFKWNWRVIVGGSGSNA